MCQVQAGAYVSLLTPGETKYSDCHPRKTTTYILHGLAPSWFSLFCGYGAGDTPRWVGTSGQHGTESGGPLVTLNLNVMARYYLGKENLASTPTTSSKPRVGVDYSSHLCGCHKIYTRRRTHHKVLLHRVWEKISVTGRVTSRKAGMHQGGLSRPAKC